MPLAIDIRAERLLPDVTERGMAHVVAQADGFGQCLVQPQIAGEGATDLGDLEGVSEPGDSVISVREDEYLGLVFQPPEGLGVQDPVPVTLERGAPFVGILRPSPTSRK